MKILYLTIIALSLSGCMAAGVPGYTNDPDQLISLSYQMLQQNRYLRTVEFANKAKELYEKDKNKEGLKNVNWVYCQLYQYKGYTYPNDQFYDLELAAEYCKKAGIKMEEAKNLQYNASKTLTSDKNFKTGQDLGSQLLDGYDQATSSFIAKATPWGANNWIEGDTGYTQTWLSGRDAAPKPDGVGIVDSNNDNIGDARIIDKKENISPMTAISEGSLISKALNKLPGFNSAAVSHDISVRTINNTLNNHELLHPIADFIFNQVTLVPVIGYNYYGLIGKTLSPKSFEAFQPSTFKNNSRE